MNRYLKNILGLILKIVEEIIKSEFPVDLSTQAPELRLKNETSHLNHLETLGTGRLIPEQLQCLFILSLIH